MRLNMDSAPTLKFGHPALPRKLTTMFGRNTLYPLYPPPLSDNPPNTLLRAKTLSSPLKCQFLHVVDLLAIAFKPANPLSW